MRWSFFFLKQPIQSLKRLVPDGLFGRSLLILMMPLVIAQISLGYVFFERHTETVLQTIADRIAGNIAIVRMWCTDHRMPFAEIKRIAHDHMSMNVTVEPLQKLERTGQYKNTWLYTPLVTALNEKLGHTPYYVRLTSDFVIITVENDDGLMHITLQQKLFFSRTTPLVLIWTTVSALILFCVASLFMRNQIRPIRRLAKAADAFGRGDDDVSFAPEGAMEVRKAGFAFLHMKERVKRLLSERLEMLAGVSHDLRTPITRLKLSSVMLPEEVPQKQQITSDVTMLHHMVEGFLSYARGVSDEPLTEIVLRSWIEQLVSCHTKIPIRVEGDLFLKISVKTTFINRCLTNLVVNSEKNADHLLIHVQHVGNMAVITLDDDGPGIPDSEYENVFRPFYRLDHSRNLDSVGVGLGLSVARDVVLSHGGTIELSRSATLGGLRVKISLPLGAMLPSS